LDSSDLASVRSLHLAAVKTTSQLEMLGANVMTFNHQVDFKFKGKLARKSTVQLQQAKETAELEHFNLVKSFSPSNGNGVEFVKAFNAMTDAFQSKVANSLSEGQYKTLLELGRDEPLVLADPDAIDAYFGQGTAKKVYPNRL
jgi:hypothetical protein